MLKKTLLLLATLLACGLALLTVRALGLKSKQPRPEMTFDLALDEQAALERFARSITFETVSTQDRVPDHQAFLDLHAFLRESFPLVHETLDVEPINELSLLFTWTGSERELRPALLMGHLDVVPVSPGTEADWTEPPFSGRIDGGYVSGRGSMDDKVSVLAILEAVERLIADGFTPRRTLYLAFGHDEEIGGDAGAAVIVTKLAERGVDELAIVLDEGGAVVSGMTPGLSNPIAVIGIAEKGSVTLDLRVAGVGGHSSAPPAQTSIGVLAAAIARLESDPFPTQLSGATRQSLEFLGPELPFAQRLLFANLWLFEPLIKWGMAAEPASRASIHTTTAATIIQGGIKANVLPSEATATVNFRILPGESPATVAARVRRVIDDDRVEVRGEETGREPSPVSRTDSQAFATLGRTVREVMGEEVLVAPYLVTAGTDARHYSALSRNVYRFTPMRFGTDSLARLHGTNERLPTEDYLTYVRFVYRLIDNLDRMPD